jgi:ABC-2 type transport system ATP-binding protein
LRTHSGDGAFSAPVKNGVQALSQVLRELEAKNVAIIDIGLRRPTLDDVFVELTGHAAEESSNA